MKKFLNEIFLANTCYANYMVENFKFDIEALNINHIKNIPLFERRRRKKRIAR